MTAARLGGYVLSIMYFQASQAFQTVIDDTEQLMWWISIRSRWRQDSMRECLSETCWKQQKTKETRCGCYLYKYSLQLQ